MTIAPPLSRKRQARNRDSLPRGAYNSRNDWRDHEDNGTIMERLNKYLAHAGVGSRRHCDELIAAGRVRVDGQKVRDLGTRVDPEQHEVSVDGKPVRSERTVHWLVNKPRGVL